MEKQIEEAILASDFVLVGIGREFTEKAPEASGEEALSPYEESRFYAELPADHEVIQAYNALRRVIGERPHFVVTLNTDDLIYRSEFEAEQIVAPCGSMEKLQCREHIVEAKAIREQILQAWEAGHGQKNGRNENPSVQMTATEIVSRYAVCPTCGAPLAFHTIANPDYLESGYLPQWEHYKKWLTATLNKKLCILELGVDFTFPQVIRFPFEKTAFYNKKSTFVRVNSRFPQLEAELAAEGRAIARTESPVEALLK